MRRTCYSKRERHFFPLARPCKNKILINWGWSTKKLQILQKVFTRNFDRIAKKKRKKSIFIYCRVYQKDLILIASYSLLKSATQWELRSIIIPLDKKIRLKSLFCERREKIKKRCSLRNLFHDNKRHPACLQVDMKFNNNKRREKIHQNIIN